MAWNGSTLPRVEIDMAMCSCRYELRRTNARLMWGSQVDEFRPALSKICAVV
jgi:hypothetical protein